MAVIAPTQVYAELLERPMKSGLNRPLLIAARGANGPVRCVVKLAAWLSFPPTEYLCEWIAAAVARALGIAVPEPLSVAMTHAFANAIDDADIREDATRSCMLAFGSTLISGGILQWTPAYGVHPEQRTAASELLAFDAFIHNTDRTADNPNVLTRRDEFVAIDHDLAFEFILPPTPYDPVLDPRLDVVRKHAFGQALRGKLGDLRGFREALQSLTDSWFHDLRSATPKEWVAGPASGKFDRIVAVLRDRRDHVDKWLPQVEAWTG